MEVTNVILLYNIIRNVHWVQWMLASHNEKKLRKTAKKKACKWNVRWLKATHAKTKRRTMKFYGNKTFLSLFPMQKFAMTGFKHTYLTGRITFHRKSHWSNARLSQCPPLHDIYKCRPKNIWDGPIKFPVSFELGIGISHKVMT